MRWSAASLEPSALGVSASRRTDVPALFAPWFAGRLDAGFVEYVPAGPPRRVRRSLRPEHVTHFTFWTKWPRPFLGVLDRVLDRGFPVLFQVTVTGLGGTDVEPGVPAPGRVVDAVAALRERLPAAALAWRYDPVFLSARFDEDHHRRTFRRLADCLAGKVDRVVISSVAEYGRRVRPDLRAWERESGDTLVRDPGRLGDLAAALAELAGERGLPLHACCAPDLGLPPAGCNAWSWACRVHPELGRHRSLPTRPGRPGCVCSEEIDIGVYDTCTLGCRYSYGSCSRARARRARHDPRGACILAP